MSPVPASWHMNSRSYYGAKSESKPIIYLRHQRSCSDYGPVMFDSTPECDMSKHVVKVRIIDFFFFNFSFDSVCGETAYHRQTFMALHSEGSDIAKSSEPSWVAAQGKDCACIVTWNMGNSKKHDDFKDIFIKLFKETEAAVSLQLGINEITVGNGRLGINEITVGNGRAASFVERNNIVVTSFLRKLLKKKPDFLYHDTIKLAVSLFDQVFHGFVEAVKIKVFVLKNGTENIITVEDETLLEESRKFYGEKRLSMNGSCSNESLQKNSQKLYRKMRNSMKRSGSMKRSRQE